MEMEMELARGATGELWEERLKLCRGVKRKD